MLWVKSLRIILNKAFLEKSQAHIIFRCVPLERLMENPGKCRWSTAKDAFSMRTAPSLANTPVIIAKLPEDNKWVSVIDPTLSSLAEESEVSDLLLHLERGG